MALILNWLRGESSMLTPSELGFNSQLAERGKQHAHAFRTISHSRGNLVQSLSRVQFFVTPRTVAFQASLSFNIS